MTALQIVTQEKVDFDNIPLTSRRLALAKVQMDTILLKGGRKLYWSKRRRTWLVYSYGEE